MGYSWRIQISLKRRYDYIFALTISSVFHIRQLILWIDQCVYNSLKINVHVNYVSLSFLYLVQRTIPVVNWKIMEIFKVKVKQFIFLTKKYRHNFANICNWKSVKFWILPVLYYTSFIGLCISISDSPTVFPHWWDQKGPKLVCGFCDVLLLLTLVINTSSNWF